jgi:hypothetical protein
MEHLLNSDRLTRNLYDLRQINELPDEEAEVEEVLRIIHEIREAG